MAFSDQASVAVLSMLGADWEILNTSINCPDMGWDVMTATAIKDYGATVRTAAQVAAEWPIGRRVVTGQNFWTVVRVPTRLGGNIWQLQITAHGLAATRPPKHRVTTASSTIERTNFPILLPDGSAAFYAPTVRYRKSSPVLEASYVLIGQDPPLNRIGGYGPQFQTPPVNIPVTQPVLPFQPAAADFIYNLPAGWNMDNLDAEPLVGTDVPVHLITETWTHQFYAELI